MMRNYIYSLYLITILVGSLCALPVSANVILVPSATTVGTGQTVDIDVISNNPAGGGDLILFGFDIDPNGLATGLSLDSIQLGSLFDSITSVADVAGAIALSTPPGSTDGQSVTLATLSFTATGTGTQQLFVSGFLSDGPDYGLYFEDFFFDQDVIALTSITIVPLPPALWLFGAGLLGLIGLSRRSKLSRG
jgi:hypothetical protein